MPKGAIGSDFTSVTSTKNSKEEKKSQKKIQQLIIEPPKEVEENLLPLLPEHISELLYSDLLSKLVIYDQNLMAIQGKWRTHVAYITNLSKVVHHFNAIEFHEAFITTLLDAIRCGN